MDSRRSLLLLSRFLADLAVYQRAFAPLLGLCSPLLLAIAHNNQLDSTLPDHRLVDTLLFKKGRFWNLRKLNCED